MAWHTYVERVVAAAGRTGQKGKKRQNTILFVGSSPAKQEISWLLLLLLLQPYTLSTVGPRDHLTLTNNLDLVGEIEPASQPTKQRRPEYSTLDTKRACSLRSI